MHVRFIAPAADLYSSRIAVALRAIGHTVDTGPGPADALLADAAGLPAYPGNLAQVTALVGQLRPVEAMSADADLLAKEKALFAGVSRIVASSQQVAARLTADFDVPAGKIVVIAPGTDDHPRALGSDGPPCHILSVGELSPHNGHDMLIKGLARLFDLDWHLTIAGRAADPVHAAGLQALAEDLNTARHVTLANDPDTGALEALWQSADVFALTPHLDADGIVLAEALRRGLPVLATATGAAAELVGPDCGAVCPVGDIDQISKALRRLIFDKALRADIADAAWQAGQALPSWRDQAAKLAAALG